MHVDSVLSADLEDAKLVGAARAGSAEAFAVLVDPYRSRPPESSAPRLHMSFYSKARKGRKRFFPLARPFPDVKQ